MVENRSRLLLAEEGQRVHLLRLCCADQDGRDWCRQQFTVFEILNWMWAEGQGDSDLLALWPLPPSHATLILTLAPDGYKPGKLVQMLFPRPGRYRLDESGISGPVPRELPGELIALLRSRIRELKPPPGYRFRENDECLELLPEEMGPRLSLTQEVLQESGAEMVVYDAKDNGEIDGSLGLAAGPQLEKAWRRQLAESTRELGQAHLTPAFGQLERLGTRWVGHIITIVQDTPEGPWCPRPERLAEGVESILSQAEQLRVSRVAITSLGTGQGRVPPERCARILVEAVRKHQREHPTSEMRVTFCLPVDRDFQAFQQVLAS